MIVVLTIHGIGFQGAPGDLASTDGYADSLHEHLRAHLTGALGDDPNRVAAGGRGPVYAQSNYPPHTGASEPGIGRLGSWTATGSVDITRKPLAQPGAAVAHVALVYSGLEGQQGDVTALLGMDVLAATSLTDYATLGGFALMVVQDLSAFGRHPGGDGSAAPSLQPRTDTQMHRGIVRRLVSKISPASATTSATSPLGILHTVEDDVAAYVTRNEHRERVRGFLRDAASRLLARPDVGGIVVNGHSNGTVMGFDLIAALSPPSAQRVRAFITSGSPLRKYAELLDWGRDAGNIRLMRDKWTNLWDPLDPVADLLSPPFGWKREPNPTLPTVGSMFLVHNPETGDQSEINIIDHQVDNVSDSQGGGLRAHNYWDNDAFAIEAANVIETAVA